MEVKTIKGIDEETWTRFKVLAAKKRLTMGKLLSDMVVSYSKHSDDTWDKILYSGKIISDKEAEDIHKITKKIRKESWVRNADSH
jgi:hypothetical protein